MDKDENSIPNYLRSAADCKWRFAVMYVSKNILFSQLLCAVAHNIEYVSDRVYGSYR